MSKEYYSIEERNRYMEGIRKLMLENKELKESQKLSKNEIIALRLTDIYSKQRSFETRSELVDCYYYNLEDLKHVEPKEEE